MISSTTPHVPAQVSGFDLRTFAPAWGSSVMGTAALAVALLAVGEGTAAAVWTTPLARAVLVVALLLGTLVLGATASRWVRHTEAARADLRHPMKGGMTATAAGALLTLAVAVGRVGPGFLPGPLIETAVLLLASSGAVLALLIGWEFLAEMFTTEDPVLAQVSGAWFVPPVVTIIVPLAVVPLVIANPGAATDLLVVAWAFLGIGAVLYLVVTAALFLRSISHPLPPVGLAPTLFIGMGPAGLLALDLVRLAQVSVQVGLVDAWLITAVLPAATMLWGFGLWWMVSALLVLRRGYANLPFTLSWWGFTFPLGAWTISTIALGRAWDSGLLTALGWVAVTVLSVLWAAVLLRTLAGVRTGTVWAH
jgi:C4-dicarboxylate transporter/malic acid transport protein